jgi:hypothetical protein
MISKFEDSRRSIYSKDVDIRAYIQKNVDAYVDIKGLDIQSAVFTSVNPTYIPSQGKSRLYALQALCKHSS